MSTPFSRTKTMLPIPPDDFKMPVPTDEEFFKVDPEYDEDADLLDTGAWKDEPDDDLADDEA